MKMMKMTLSNGRSQISPTIHQVQRGRSEGTDYWVRTQKENRPEVEISITRVAEKWVRLSKREHDELRAEAIKSGRWLRDHV